MDTSPDLLGENYQITDGLSMDALLDLSHISGGGKQSQSLPIRPPLWQGETMRPIVGGCRGGCYLERYLLRMPVGPSRHYLRPWRREHHQGSRSQKGWLVYRLG